MNKRNLEILGLSEGATIEEVKEKYQELKVKYSEERFLDGEAGNEAARMLNKIEVAYQELCVEFDEMAGDGKRGNAYEQVDELIRNNKLNEAQQMLDAFNERPAEWHYMQSVVFYKKSWINESKKQLEIAMHMEPDNEKYRSSYEKLMQKIEYEQQLARQNAQYGNANGPYGQGQQNNNANYNRQQQQMGGGCCDCLMACCLFQLCCRS